MKIRIPCIALAATCLSLVAALAASSTNSISSNKAPTAEMLPGKGPVQAGDWFDKVWSERRAEFRRRAAQDQGALVFVGDSITQGWGDLQRQFPQYQCANCGISGDTTRGVLFRLQEDVLDLKPAAIVLLIGTNDIGIGADPADAADNTGAILTAVRQFNSSLPVVVCKVMPRSDGVSNAIPRIEELNARVDRFVEADPHCIRCDTWSIYGDDGTATSAEFYDRLHLNEAGYEKWKAALLPLLANLSLPSGAAK